MGNYEPELGQAVFGQPYKQYDVPVELEEAMDTIRCAISAINPLLNNPFSNSGSRYRWSCFQAHAYSWGDDDQPWNFKWKDFEVSWYKYWGRGMSRNRKISAAEIKQMIRECTLAVFNEEPIEDCDG